MRCDWCGAWTIRLDGFCCDAHRHAWYAQERRYEMQREADEDELQELLAEIGVED